MKNPPPPRPVTVGMGDYIVTTDPQAVLTTCAIGSCLAVAAHDPVAGVGGILHFVLPNSQLNTTMAQIQPRMFGDTGLKDFLYELGTKGARNDRLEVRLAGGALVVREMSHSDIGTVNVQTARRILEDRGLSVKAADTGGGQLRTLCLEMNSGRVTVREGNSTRVL
jgi:chemotaxis protein CheD